MAEKPITFDEIIQQGNIFQSWIDSGEALISTFNLIEEEGKKMNASLVGQAKQMKETLSGANPASKEDQQMIVDYAAKIEGLEEQIKKLNEALDKMKKAKKQVTEEEVRASVQAAKTRKELKDQIDLEGAAADSKLALKKRLSQLLSEYDRASKEAAQKMAPSIKKLRDEIAKAEQAVGTHSRSVGWYEKAWKGASGVIAKVSGVLAGAYGAIKIGSSIINSASSLADELKIGLKGISDGWQAVAKSVATGDFSNFITNIKSAVSAGREYAAVMDALEDRMRAYTIQEADANKEISRLKFVYKDVTRTNQERIAAIDEILRLEKELSENRVTITQKALDAEISRTAKLNGLTELQIMQYLNQDKALIANIETGRALIGMYDVYLGQGAAGIIQAKAFKNNLTDQQKEMYNLALAFNKVNESGELDKITAAYVSNSQAQTQWMDNTNRAWSTRQGMIDEINKEEQKKTKETTEVIQAEFETREEIFDNYVNNKVPNLLDQEAAAIDEYIDAEIEKSKDKNDQLLEQTKERIEAEKEAERLKEEYIADLKQGAFEIGQALIGYQLATNQAAMDAELKAAGDNAAMKEQIERKYALKQQKIQLGEAVINGAQAITEIWAKYAANPVYAAVLSGIAALQTGIQIATIKKQKFAQGGYGLLDFEGGVLPGKSHAQGGVDLGQIGEAEGGEYFGIINKAMTRKYAGVLPNIFESINRGNFEDIWKRTEREIQPVIINNDNGRILSEINKNLSAMADRQTIDLGDRVMYKNGNSTVIVKK